jgi:hypothetical protein
MVELVRWMVVLERIAKFLEVHSPALEENLESCQFYSLKVDVALAFYILRVAGIVIRLCLPLPSGAIGLLATVSHRTASI